MEQENERHDDGAARRRPTPRSSGPLARVRSPRPLNVTVIPTAIRKVEVLKPEQRIEDQIISNLEQLGYANALWIRRAKICRGGFGTVDLLLLPINAQHHLVLVEVKQENSGDAAGKVIGQLLLYYVGALGLGLEGLRLLREFARSPRAHDTTPKSLQMLSGGHCKGEDWRALEAGDKLDPGEVSLIVGLEKKPHPSLLALRSWLKKRSSLDIKIVVAHGDGPLEEC